MGGMNPGLASRYGMGAGGGGGRYGGAGGGGMGGRYGGGMGGRYGGMSQSGGGMGYGMPEESSMDDLEEKPLTVNMLLEVISIPPPAEESDEGLASEEY